MIETDCILTICGDGYPNMLVGSFAFSWKIEGEAGKQRSYDIFISSLNQEIIWRSGEIVSTKSAGISYSGPKLNSNSIYKAWVLIKCESGKKYKSKEKIFQTGLQDVKNEWKAAWLTSPYVKAVSQIFRKQFLISKIIKRARAYICGLGYYELYVNGAKIGNRLLDPAWTDYEKRVNYVVFDLHDALYKGENTIGISLGCGWFSNEFGNPRPLVSLQLILEYENGSKEYITTQADGTWKCLKETWIVKNSIYLGEQFDARKYIEAWATSNFKYEKGTWNSAILGEPPHGVLCPMAVEPIRCIKTLSPISINERKPGVWIIDFGQNFAGIVNIKLHNLIEGTEIRFRYAEIVDSDGLLNTKNLRNGQACDIFISGGKDEECYQSSFTYHGFRFIEIIGLPYILSENDIVALVIRSDVRIRSSFVTSNPLLNKIQTMCCWTESNNLHSIPTDCPQRDERLGWLNDLTVRLEEAIYNFDLHVFLRKFFTDIKDAQGITGAITDTVPYRRLGFCPADPVCSSYILIPWMLWKHYDDQELLVYSWTGLKAWTDFLSNSRNDEGIVSYSYYGDWAGPIDENERYSAGYSAVSATTPGGLMSTGFLYMDALLLAEIAKELNYCEEEKYYLRLSEETKNALNSVYLNKEKAYYASNSQASNTFMLYLDIVPKEYKAKVIDNLVTDIRKHNVHTTTGNICTRYIYDVLAENGYIDLAYELLNQTTYPSWGYMLYKGATTTWERWEYVDSGELVGMASHDHPMYATISGWFYKYLAGIRPGKNGFESFSIKPYIPHKLQQISAKVETVKGKISVEILNTGSHVRAEVTVPFNSICRYEVTDDEAVNIMLDGGPISNNLEFGSGIHVVEFDR